MSDYLGNLADRTLNRAEVIEPRLAARFESVQVQGSLGVSQPAVAPALAAELEFENEHEADPVLTSPVPPPARRVPVSQPVIAPTQPATVALSGGHIGETLYPRREPAEAELIVFAPPRPSHTDHQREVEQYEMTRPFASPIDNNETTIIKPAHRAEKPEQSPQADLLRPQFQSVDDGDTQPAPETPWASERLVAQEPQDERRHGQFERKQAAEALPAGITPDEVARIIASPIEPNAERSPQGDHLSQFEHQQVTQEPPSRAMPMHEIGRILARPAAPDAERRLQGNHNPSQIGHRLVPETPPNSLMPVREFERIVVSPTEPDTERELPHDHHLSQFGYRHIVEAPPNWIVPVGEIEPIVETVSAANIVEIEGREARINRDAPKVSKPEVQVGQLDLPTRPMPVVAQPRVAIAPVVKSTSPLTDQLPPPREEIAAPTIQVTIGRIEVRATQPPITAPTRKTNAAPVMSLADYLQARNGGSR